MDSGRTEKSTAQKVSTRPSTYCVDAGLIISLYKNTRDEQVIAHAGDFGCLFQEQVITKEVCKEAGISSATLYNWLRRRRESSVSGFVPVVSAPAREAVLPLELEYPGGVKLRVSSADLDLLSRLIRL